MAPTIVGLGGSLARASKSRAALQRALQGSTAAGAQTRLLDLRELVYPGAPHGITDTHKEQLGNDLLAFLRSSTGAPELVGSSTRKDYA